MVDKKFDARSQTVRSVLSMLHELRGAVIFPGLPEIRSIKLFKHIRAGYQAADPAASATVEGSEQPPAAQKGSR